MADVASDFGEAVISGLSQPRRIISARYLYDVRGSELFEQITRLPEYYPTRTETLLLKRHAADLGRLSGRGRPVVEFGAGSAAKTPLLLDATGATTYVPIDISKEFLEGAMARLAATRPALRIVPIAGDFTHPLKLPPLAGPLTGFFPGSTIGNFDHRSAVNLLEAAYDDAAGITAAFNLNLLQRINRELDGTIPIDAFEHRAVWHDGLGRVEMHLVANRDVAFVAAGRRFSMGAGETIHTENSYKYTLEEARLLARASGWEPLAFWTDPDGLFGLHVWTAASDELQP
jgi:uncharacterized SAM-dependent methyltransferase